MADMKSATVIRDFSRALELADVERAVAPLTEDGVWATPEGTFEERNS